MFLTRSDRFAEAPAKLINKEVIPVPGTGPPTHSAAQCPAISQCYSAYFSDPQDQNCGTLKFSTEISALLGHFLCLPFEAYHSRETYSSRDKSTAGNPATRGTVRLVRACLRRAGQPSYFTAFAGRYPTNFLPPESFPQSQSFSAISEILSGQI